MPLVFRELVSVIFYFTLQLYDFASEGVISVLLKTFLEAHGNMPEVDEAQIGPVNLCLFRYRIRRIGRVRLLSRRLGLLSRVARSLSGL